MSDRKKKDQNNTDAPSKAYDLHTEAIDALVNASESNSPEVAEKEIKKYRRDLFGKIPVFVKALFIKFWFNGAICYFFFFGLGVFFKSMLDRLVVLAVGMGVINDLLVKNALLYFDNGNGYADWTLFPYRKFWTLIANIVYSFVLTAFVVFVYVGVNYLINGTGDAMKFEIKVEPLLFALINLLADLTFLGFKRLFIKIIADANNKLDGKSK